MTKAKKKSVFSWQLAAGRLKKFYVPVILLIIFIMLTLFTYETIIKDKYYPQTFALDTNISFLTEGQAIRKLQAKFAYRTSQKLQFDYPQKAFTIDLTKSSASLDYTILTNTFTDSHSGTILEQLQKQLLTLFSPKKIYPSINLNLDKQINAIQDKVYKNPQNAELTFDEITNQEGSSSARIQIKESVNGLSLDKETLQAEIRQFILTGKYKAELPLISIPPKITTDHILKAKQILENVSQAPIKLIFGPAPDGTGQVDWVIDAKQLLTLLDLEQDLLLNKDKTYQIIEKIGKEINQEVQEGLFEFNPNTKKVSAFKPSHEGKKLDKDKAYQMLVDALENPQANSPTINLPVDIIKPKIQTSEVNNLGIKELLGRGISNFAGSIANRIYNINLTASRINGILVPPGEIFSFNKTIGDISAATGFKQAYVIKEGRTVLDDGGGVCQDSTTLFRAVLNAGLPVLKRTAHAYRVGYYEQGFPAGLDATVFYPSVDFQFKNDTPAYILVQAYTFGTTLYVDLYGSSDNRAVTLTKPVVTNQTPPPPELRQDDPSLPKGTVKQVDWSAWGATVTFSRTVTRNGEEIIKETFKSNYKPWQAVFLVGTQ